jgi:hypothetical protein
MKMPQNFVENMKNFLLLIEYQLSYHIELMNVMVGCFSNKNLIIDDSARHVAIFIKKKEIDIGWNQNIYQS